MERVAADIEGLHLGIADFDAFLVGALVENAFDARSPRNTSESIRRTRLHAQLDSLIFARRLTDVCHLWKGERSRTSRLAERPVELAERQ
jgi:hypothetical protein